MKKILSLFCALAIVLSASASPISSSAFKEINKAELSRSMGKVGAVRSVKAPRAIKAPQAASDYVIITEQPAGDLQTYSRSGGHYIVSNQQISFEDQSGTIDIVFGAANKVYFKNIVAGLSTGAWVEGNLSKDGTTITVALGQNLYYSETYDACVAIGLITYESGTGFSVDTKATSVTFSVEGDVISLQGTGFASKSLGGVWTDDGSIQNYGDYESVYAPYVEPKVVELPEGAELVEYAMSYTDYNGNAVSGSAAVAVVGDEVYIQGFSQYIPEALIKGTKNGNTITFPANQFLGTYGGSYTSYFIKEAVFTYDEANDTYSATGAVYSLLNGKYIDVYASDPVLKGVVEKAAQPADPVITALNNGNYGYYITFNVPNVDVDGEGLVSSKLFYEIYTDTEKDIQPLTFTPSTHIYLTENLTTIPFGFSEDYDFYTTQIYLNDLFSATWNRIGIKSIYKGGDEVHETEIQWFKISDYLSFSFSLADSVLSITPSNNCPWAGMAIPQSLLDTEFEGDVETFVNIVAGMATPITGPGSLDLTKLDKEEYTPGEYLFIAWGIIGERIVAFDKFSFTIEAAPEPTTAIDNTGVAVKATKRIENGQLVIEKNGVRYNALGAEVK